MKLKKLFPILMALVLVGCKPTPSSSEQKISSEEVTTSISDEQSSEKEEASTEEVVSSAEEASTEEVSSAEEPSISEEPSSEEPSISEEPSSEEPEPVDEADYTSVFAGLDAQPEYHPQSNHELQTIVAYVADDVLAVKFARRVANPNANNDNFWDNNQLDVFLDLGNEGGEALDANDIHFLIRPDGTVSVQKANNGDWDEWLDGSWGIDNVFGMKVLVESSPYSIDKVVVAYIGINLAIHEYEIGDEIGVAVDLANDTVIKNPSLYDKLPVYNEDSTFKAGEHQFADRLVKVLATPKAYNIVVKRTVGEFVDDLWHGASNLFLLFAGDGDAAGAAPNASDIKVISAHVGYSVAAVGNGSGWEENPWLDGSWALYNIYRSGVWFSITIDGNELTFNVSINLSTLSLEVPSDSVRAMAEAGGHETTPSAWQLITLE